MASFWVSVLQNGLMSMVPQKEELRRNANGRHLDGDRGAKGRDQVWASLVRL